MLFYTTLCIIPLNENVNSSLYQRSLQGRSNLVSNNTVSVEVLHKPEIKTPPSPLIRVDLAG